jgi:uncharacterized protein
MNELPPDLHALGLTAHPEGGFYLETHRSEACTVIDFALLAGTFSAWHRVHGAEEVWLHHRGAPVALHLWDGRTHQRIVLGDGRSTAVVPAGVWQAAEPEPTDQGPGWTWVSCVVTPPFVFDAFELATDGLVLPPALRKWLPRR